MTDFLLLLLFITNQPFLNTPLTHVIGLLMLNLAEYDESETLSMVKGPLNVCALPKIFQSIGNDISSKCTWKIESPLDVIAGKLKRVQKK